MCFALSLSLVLCMIFTLLLKMNPNGSCVTEVNSSLVFVSLALMGTHTASGFCFRLAAFDTEEENNIKQNQQVSFSPLIPFCPAVH